MAAADRGQHLDPVAPWKHPVEDHQVDGLGEGEALSLGAVAGGEDRVALRLKAALEEVGDRRFVLDDQDLHAADARSHLQILGS